MSVRVLSLHAVARRGKQILRRWGRRIAATCILLAPILFWAFITFAQSAESSPCERLVYDGSEKVLFIEDDYFVFPRRTDGLLITLSVRYRDLAPSDADGKTDSMALDDPRWSIDHTDKSALLYIYRSSFKWASTVEMLRDIYRTGSVIETDWPGWIKFAICIPDCVSSVYTSEQWRALGVDSVECRESATVDPLKLTCQASDHISGVPVQYDFPSVKKDQFVSFRQRISTFISSLEEKAKEFCK